MAGVRQFRGSSSAMKISVKGTLRRSSSGDTSRPADFFADAPGERAIVEAFSEAQGKGHYVFYLPVAQGLGSLLHPRRLGRLPQVAGLLVERLLQARALVGQPPPRVGWLLVTLVTAPPWRCPKKCFDGACQPQYP
ncbi:UNVERIFIED_CONTAM: hypothetical protein Slati_4477200 [Sesamum latifolium]|uniref:Uncharacterized protein n=1 Tax=Sesamum latifolium TaxID=2727402 RepID=A0AAW2SRJ6_9LAMI